MDGRSVPTHIQRSFPRLVVTVVLILSAVMAPSALIAHGATTSDTVAFGATMRLAQDSPGGIGSRDVLSIGLAPVKSAFDLNRGESRAFTAYFTAAGNEPVHATVSYSDVLLRSDGGFEFLEPGEEYWSAGKWLSVSPLEFALEPGQQQLLTVILTVPEDVPDGEYYAAFFVRADPRSEPGASTGVLVGGRLTSVVCMAIGESFSRSARLVPYGDVPRENPSLGGWAGIVATLTHWHRCLVIDERNVAILAEPKPLTVFVPLENTSSVHIEPRVTASFSQGETLQHKVIYSGEIILPGRSKVLAVQWSAPPVFGQFRLELEIEYGGPEPIEVERVFWVVPLKGIVGLLAIAFGLGYLSATRTRSRSRIPAAP